MTDDGKIECKIDGARVHVIQNHLKEHHPEWTIEQYRAAYPDAPLLSDHARRLLQERKKKMAESTAAAVARTTGPTRKPLAQVFGLGATKAALNKRGEPILVTIMDDLDEDAVALVPDVDPNYVFNIDLVKTALIGLELNIPMYFWGLHGTGKTTCFEQVAARTQRPFMRVQHTINTEEAHIVGQYVVKDGATEFQMGPLPIAMINGYIYCADEYDFAMPSVLSVYQPVLEGKPLFIKDAPPELRVVRPHPNFRFVATGNTNGGGDETGLYQGTQIQNSANYSRFGIVEEVEYMDEKLESTIVSQQARIALPDARKLIEFAVEVRKTFKAGKVGLTISTRELIRAGQLGMVRGGDWRGGLRQAFMNRLSRTDKEVLDQVAQRMFG